MRWWLLLMTLLAVVLCFTRHSGGAMGWWLFVSIVGAFATALALGRPESPTTRAVKAFPLTI